MRTTAIILFVATYVLMIALPKWRYLVAIGSAVIFLVSGILPLSAVPGAIDWNVLMMLCGTMGTVSLFIASKMPNRMADMLMNKVGSVKMLVVALSLFAGIVSAFIDNVATVLMIAPVGLAIAKKLKISPVPMLICISVSSNLQGAATLVGDTTSILLGGYANMDFLDFLWMDGRLGIFWAVQLGALMTVPVILFLFRKQTEGVERTPLTKVTDFVPSWLLVLNVVLLIAASFIPNKPAITNGLICLAIFAVCMVSELVRHGSERLNPTLAEIDFQTLGLLAGLFVVIAAITQAGVIDLVAGLFVSWGGHSLFAMYSLLVWGSVVCSAFIDNIPYVATMLPVVAGISAQMGCRPELLYFGLLTGATLGGNLTPIGASANIATAGILRREGYEVTNKEFMRIGVPFTLSAVIAGYVFLWLVWGH